MAVKFNNFLIKPLNSSVSYAFTATLGLGQAWQVSNVYGKYLWYALCGAEFMPGQHMLYKNRPLTDLALREAKVPILQSLTSAELLWHIFRAHSHAPESWFRSRVRQGLQELRLDESVMNAYLVDLSLKDRGKLESLSLFIKKPQLIVSDSQEDIEVLLKLAIEYQAGLMFLCQVTELDLKELQIDVQEV